ncbi:tetratricopeptide repeat protein [bacterium]|nr:tetratricopeptide repeat protein [bacterium]
MVSFRSIRYLLVFVGVISTLIWGSYRLTEFYLLQGPSLEADAGEALTLKTLSQINAIESKDPEAAKEFLNTTYLYLLGEYWSAKNMSPKAIQVFEKALTLDPNSSELNFALAREYLSVGRVDEGIESTKRSIELDPHNRDARLLLGNLQITAKRYSEARALFSELSKEHPDDEEVLLTWVHLEIDDQNIAVAYKLLKDFLKEDPTSAAALFYLGRLEQTRGRNAAAVAAYQKALDLHPSFSQAATALAILYEDQGQKQKALELYRWLADETGHAEFEKRVAQLFMDRGQYDQALQRLLSYEEKEPSDLNNKVKIALVHMEMKSYPEATRKLEEILTLSPDSDNIRFYLAAVYQQEGKFKEAAIQYGKVESRSKLFPEALKGYVFSMKKIGKSKLAWNKLKESIEFAEKSGLERDYLYEIASSFLESSEQIEDAEVYLKKGLKLYPGNLQLIYQLATLQEKKGEFDEALKTGKMILEKDPEHVAALNFVGYLLAESNRDLIVAEKLIRKALKKRPNDPYILDSLGWALYRRGDFKEALRNLQQAFTLKPDESIIANHIGDVLLKMGELTDALDYYEKALKLGPERDDEKQALESKRSRLKERLASGNCKHPACSDFVLDHRAPAQSDNN